MDNAQSKEAIDLLKSMQNRHGGACSALSLLFALMGSVFYLDYAFGSSGVSHYPAMVAYGASVMFGVFVQGQKRG